MRLSEQDVRAIVGTFSPILKRYDGELYLFGSRVDDRKKGGDIDLLVVVAAPSIPLVAAEKLRIVDLIQRKIGEQRIDVTITSQEKIQCDEFLQSIVPSMVKLI